MCLIKNRNWQKPLRKGNIRYKVVTPLGAKSFESLYNWKIWRLGYRYICHKDVSFSKMRNAESWRLYANHNYGFHVFVTYKDAVQHINSCTRAEDLVVVQVAVENHIASGVWDGDMKTPNETWQYCKIAKAYNDPRARKDK